MHISVEGNIGVGKSELLKILALRGHRIRTEPVEAWTLLHSYYKDPETFGFALQAQILASYANVEENTIVERSARSGLEVFSQMLQKQKKLSISQIAILSAMYYDLPLKKPNIIVFLSLEPAECLKRIEKRGRESERSVDISYLENVQEHYDLFLESCATEEGVTVLRIPVDGLSPTAVADAFENALGKLL